VIRRTTVVLLIVGIVAVAGAARGQKQQWYNLPKLPPPHEYGNVLITRSQASSDLPAVSFSHWRHRLQYTCRVCHFELEFVMEANASEITEEDNRNGFFCGACHDGKRAFGHTEENCTKCHTGDIASGKEKFRALRRLPKSKYGNMIDWARAIERGNIRPTQSILDPNFTQIPYTKDLVLESEWYNVPPSVFSHGSHTRWLDCANCHPHVFNIKKKTTKHFLMENILKGQFCGACHLKVAFPIDDCWRCHPGIKR
jgi:c(7)-type cytochrome triheme protein